MRWSFKRTIRRKEGSYLVSAAVIFPMLILGTVFLISLIPVIAGCENVFYGVGEVTRLEMFRASFGSATAAEYAALAFERVKRDNPQFSVGLPQAKMLYTEEGIEDLLSVKVSGTLQGHDPLSRFRSGTYSFRVIGRAFTGKDTVQSGNPEDAFDQEKKSEIVYYFPDRGAKFHKKGCRFLQSCCQQVALTKALKKKYKGCPNCHSKKLPVGSIVYIFPERGDCYHAESCKSVTKYYIESDRVEAERKGYTACTACGG